MGYCNYQCKQQKFLDQRKIIFQKKLDNYYSKYSRHLKQLQSVANKSNPHAEMDKIRRTNEPALKRDERDIKNILEQIKSRIDGVTQRVKQNKSEINVNNTDLEKLKKELDVQERKILEKRTELESKKKQLNVGNDTNKYRRHILYLLIFFNIFLIIVIVFLLRNSSSGSGASDDGTAAAEGVDGE